MTLYATNRFVLGHGIDLIDINDFKRLLTDSLKPFLSRTFTKLEIENCGDSENQISKLAGRFAVKEAVL